MALFKVNRGIENNLPSAKTDGYVYFCKDSGHIYFDYIGDDGKLRRQEVTASIADKIKGIAVDGQYIEITAAEIKACIDKLDQEDLNIKNGSGDGSLFMNNTNNVDEPDDGNTGEIIQSRGVPEANGIGSFAIGAGTKAEGHTSTAEGINTTAGYVRDDAIKSRNVGSHAEGISTYAKSSGSHAEGFYTQSLASNSHTEGFKTTVNSGGWSGHAEGRQTIVNGKAGHAEGYLTQTNGTEAHAEGMSTKADGDRAHAEGENTIAGVKIGDTFNGITVTDANRIKYRASHAEGIETKAYIKGSHAEGIKTIASGEGAHAEGTLSSKKIGNTASGKGSHAEGGDTTASGNYSHAEGDRTIATGSAGHAEGCLTTAGYSSHAEGEQTIAGGGTTGTRGAHAEGVKTQALAFASHAGGVGSVVDNYASTAIGSYPRQIAGTPAKYNKNAVAFAVGNGTGDTARSNAFEVSFDGTGKLGGKSILTDADKAAINADIAAQLAGKVDKVDGKGLSSNDYTDADKAKVGLVKKPIYVKQVESVGYFYNIETGTEYFDRNIATDPDVGKKYDFFLCESEFGIGDMARLTVSQSDAFHLYAYLPQVKSTILFSYVNDEGAADADLKFDVTITDDFADKVDKIDGKGLSTNDYTNADKQAVERILSGEINASYIVDIGVEDKYFDIDIDGMVCLKPAYRGALPEKRSAYTYAISDAGIGVVGTKNSELPERVVIPDMVKGLPVKSMAVGMFCNNMVVKEIVLPAAVTAIPDAWCRESCVEKVLNTQNITSIGGFGFQKSRLLYANFPNLQTILGKAAFYICSNLRFANIGNVTAIPSRCFAQCGSLTEVKSNQAVTSIGDHAFATTESLRKVSFLPPTDKMQSVGERAFFSTGLNFTNAQWNSFSDNFGTEATPAQIHQDIWSECAVTPHLNGLPTALGQTDPRWKDLPIYTGTNNYGETQKTYYYGCVFFAIITAYCGLHNLSFDTVQNLAAYLDDHHSGWRPLFSSNVEHIAPFITHLGMTCEQLPFPDASSTDTLAQKTAKLQHLYDQISSGKYITFTVRGGESMYDGHAVVAFGLTEDKRFVISNSAGTLTPNMYGSTQYALPYQNLCIRNPSKPETLNTIIVLGLAEGGEDA